MGGPNNLDEVEVFLKNMFNDENIITVKSKLLRKLISFAITTMRKKEAISNYKLLGGKSPLVENTEKLIKKLQNKENEITITYAMRYTPPYSFDVIKQLIQKKATQIILIPLYPQYSTTTTKSSLDDFFQNTEKLGFKGDIKYIEKFYNDTRYNQAVIEQIKKTLNDSNPQEYDLIFSAHSLPVKIIENGDPYKNEIEKNIEILTNILQKEQINFNKIHIAYQSKLGPVEWIGPSLEKKLKEITNKKVILYPISFILDNSETMYELHIEYADIAKSLNFIEYKVCKCINDSDIFIDFLQSKIKNLM